MGVSPLQTFVQVKSWCLHQSFTPFSKANLLKDKKEFYKAIEVFQQAQREGIDDFEVNFSLGLCFEKTSRYSEAIEEYLKIVYRISDDSSQEIKPDQKNYKVRALFRIAKIYENDGNTKEARKVYEKVIAMGVDEAKIAISRIQELEGR